MVNAIAQRATATRYYEFCDASDNFEQQSTFMKSEQEYIRDLSEIRSMMERSSKFMSLAGWSGVMAGIYALAGAWVAYKLLHFNTGGATYEAVEGQNMLAVLLAGTAVLVLAIGTAIFLSYQKSKKRNEKLWNSAARRLVTSMAAPLVSGGILSVILLSKGFPELIAPLTLLFYGLALINASKFTYEEMKYLGMIEIVLGLAGALFTSYGLGLWAVGFGVMHIVYGVYLHLKYEK